MSPGRARVPPTSHVGSYRIFLIVKKLPHSPRHDLRLLEVRHMPGAVQHRDARIRDALGEFIRISRRDDVVGVAPDDQGRRGDAVDVFSQAFAALVMAE